MLSTMHADWQCWPHHDELLFDIFVTPAVTEFRDHRHKQWFKTCCLESPRHLVCGLRSAACSLPVLSSMIKVHPQGALPPAWLCQAKVKASLCACSKVCLPLLLESLANQQGTSHILRGSLVNLVFQAGREPGHAAVGRCAGPSYGAQDLLQDGQAQRPRAGGAGRISMESSGAPIMLKIDKELAEKQKTSRVGNNGGTPTANHGVTASEESEGNEEDKTAQNKSKNENIGGDTYYPGNFAVLSSFRDVDRRKAMEFHFKIFDDLRLKAAEFPFQDFRRSSRRGRAMTTNDESDSNEDDNTEKSARSKPKNENIGGRPHYSSGLSSVKDADGLRALCSESLDAQDLRRYR